jgi:tyrosyl-tRNA synthetase
MFGKMMSIPDDLMWSYYELVTDRTEREIAELKSEVAAGKLHPMDAKMKLGEEVVSVFQGVEAGRKAAENFQRVFRDRQAPVEMNEIRLKRQPDGSVTTQTEDIALQVISASPKWPQLLKYLSQAESVSDAARTMEQGGLEVDGIVFRDPRARLDTSFDRTYEVRFGKKKFFRLIVE